MSKNAFKQVKEARDSLVKDQETDLLVSTVPTEMNPMYNDPNILRPVPGGTPVPGTVRVWVPPERRTVSRKEENSSGLSSNLGLMLLMTVDGILSEYATFTLNGKDYRVGVITPDRKFGRIYGYHAPLLEADDA